jgi:hypothetical protein
MIKKVIEEISIFQFENLHKRNIFHFSCGSTGGVSQDHLKSLNLGFTVNDNPENVIENRKKVAKALGVNDLSFLFAKQISAAEVAVVSKAHLPSFIGEIHCELQGIDAMITNKKGICLTILTADCVPVLLFDFDKKVIAVSHAGWKGTACLITQKTVSKMKENFGCNPKHIIAGIGPSISLGVYEIGDDVVKEIKQTHTHTDKILIFNSKTEKWHLNLWEANKQQLISEGIPDENIEISNLCTYTNSDIFYSARKTKGRTGRFASGIMLIN